MSAGGRPKSAAKIAAKIAVKISSQNQRSKPAVEPFGTPPARPPKLSAGERPKSAVKTGGQIAVKIVEPFGACRSRARPRQIWWSSLLVRFCNGRVALPADPDPRAPARVPPARPCPDPAWNLARTFAARDSRPRQEARPDSTTDPAATFFGGQERRRSLFFGGQERRRWSSLFSYPRLFVVRRSRGAASRRDDARPRLRPRRF